MSRKINNPVEEKKAIDIKEISGEEVYEESHILTKKVQLREYKLI